MFGLLKSSIRTSSDSGSGMLIFPAQACLRFLGFEVMLCKFPILCPGRGGHNHEMSRRLRDPLRNMNKCKDCQFQNISEQQQEGCPSFIINLALYLTYLFLSVISVLVIYAHSGRPSSHAARFWIYRSLHNPHPPTQFHVHNCRGSCQNLAWRSILPSGRSMDANR